MNLNKWLSHDGFSPKRGTTEHYLQELLRRLNEVIDAKCLALSKYLVNVNETATTAEHLFLKKSKVIGQQEHELAMPRR